ncbi:hypothetical protein ACFRCX_30465 [Streptomyces sp. NPDC056652]|uniref:hypothetical protein n=1 Tax=Streptomyces sp. NPDC056652 TaxID=3345893 RepID=UPI0036C0AD27
MDSRDLYALSLLAQLQRLATNDADAAVRITIRSADGDYIGEARLPANAAQEATNAFSVIADYQDAQQAIPYTMADGTVPELDVTDVPAPKLRVFDETVTDLHPAGIAEIEDLFDTIDLIRLNDLVLSEAPPGHVMRAIQAIDDVFGDVVDPQAAEDGDL